MLTTERSDVDSIRLELLVCASSNYTVRASDIPYARSGGSERGDLPHGEKKCFHRLR